MVDDINQMERYAAVTPPPPAWIDWPVDVPLPHPVLDAEPGTEMGPIAAILYYGAAILQNAYIGPVPRSRRSPPSHGASHPWELQLSLRGTEELPPGTYRYNAHRHGMQYLGPPDVEAGADDGQATYLLEFLPAFARSWWRYRSSGAFPTVYMDLGHLVETCLRVSEAWNWPAQLALEPGCADELDAPVHIARIEGCRG